MLAVAALVAACGGEERPPSDATATGPSRPSAPAPPRRAAPPRPGAPLLVATLGDSITAGNPLHDPAREDGDNDPASQYQFWAARRLGPRVRFRNCGVGGETTPEIALRLDECARGADALIVQGGINDIARGLPVDVAARNLRAMVRRGRELGLRVAIVDLLPWNGGHPEAAPLVNDLNRRIAVIAREERVPLIPFFAALEDPARPDRMRPEWTDDGDHPSVAGYRRMGAVVKVP